MANIEIVAQTAAKVAAEISAPLQARTVEEAIGNWASCYDSVLNRILAANNNKDRKTTGGRAIPIVSQETMKVKLDEAIRAGAKVDSNIIHG